MTIEIRRDPTMVWVYERTPAGTERLAATRCETSGSVLWYTEDEDVKRRVVNAMPPRLKQGARRRWR